MTPEQAERARKQQEKMFRDIQRAILRVQSYSAFDALSFRVEGSTVQLMGYAWRPTTSTDAARRVQRVKGVETVENLIEVLPVSNVDDRLRGQLFANIYGHSTMQRHLRGGGLSPSDIQEALRELRFGIENVTIIRGAYPISIIVRGGNVALLGVVASNLERQIAETQANTTSGVFSVENHVQVAN